MAKKKNTRSTKLREKKKRKSQRRNQTFLQKKQEETLANGMSIRNAALEHLGYNIQKDEVADVKQPAAALTTLQEIPKWDDFYDGPCASVGTPSSSTGYPSRSPSPVRNFEKRGELASERQPSRWDPEEFRAKENERHAQALKASDAAKARRARAIFERHIRTESGQ